MRKEGEGFQKKVTANDRPRVRHGFGWLEESNAETTHQTGTRRTVQRRDPAPPPLRQGQRARLEPASNLASGESRSRGPGAGSKMGVLENGARVGMSSAGHCEPKVRVRDQIGRKRGCGVGRAAPGRQWRPGKCGMAAAIRLVLLPRQERSVAARRDGLTGNGGSRCSSQTTPRCVRGLLAPDLASRNGPGMC